MPRGTRSYRQLQKVRQHLREAVSATAFWPYALLEAMNKREGSGAEPVSVFGIAAHVSRRVPEISGTHPGKAALYRL